MVCIATYNIHCGVGNDGRYDLGRIAGTLRRSGCDVACLQEVEVNLTPRRVRKWSHEHADNQPGVLAGLSGLPHYAFSGALQAYLAEDAGGAFDEVLVRDTEGSVAYGNAILSRFPILASRSMRFTLPAPPLDEEHLYMDREVQPRGAHAVLVATSASSAASGPHAGSSGAAGAAAAQVASSSSSAPPPAPPISAGHAVSDFVGCAAAGQQEALAPSGGGGAGDGLLWVVCSHLSHKMCSEEQRSQARELVDWAEGLVRGHEGPAQPGLVLCGDLNAASFMPWSAHSVIAAQPGWWDCWSECGDRWYQATFPSSLRTTLLGLRIDHVFALEHVDAARMHCDSVRVLSSPEDSVGSDHRAVLAEICFVEEDGDSQAGEGSEQEAAA